MFSSSPRSRHSLDIWPGFVDVLATVLMAIIFVLMTFVVAQHYLTDALQGRDQALMRLNQDIEALTLSLQSEKKAKENAQTEIDHFQTLLTTLQTQLSHLQNELNTTDQKAHQEEAEKKEALSHVHSLSQNIESLRDEILRLNQALEADQQIEKEQKVQIDNLHQRLNEALLSKVEELKALNEQLQSLQETNTSLEKNLKKGGFGFYRSEFFAKLKKAIGERSDIRVVGDRFVFQSEVLFDIASAELGPEGQKQLNQLAIALKEITSNIPKDLPWILRIDGHTDNRPIHTTQFPSNWELSTARAIAVVQYLISQGISPHNLAATGFGEFQPLSQSKTEKDLARNRRIEFKLDAK